MFRRKKAIVVSHRILQLEKHYIVIDYKRNKKYIKGVKFMDLDNEELTETKQRTEEKSR